MASIQDQKRLTIYSLESMMGRIVRPINNDTVLYGILHQ